MMVSLLAFVTATPLLFATMTGVQEGVAANTPLAVKARERGCVMAGKRYPEGARYPPQRPGATTLTVAVYVCRNGKWVLSGG